MQLSGALSGPGSNVPTGGDPKFTNTGGVAPSIVICKTTDAISSVPAPSLQIVIVYFTSNKQK
jgi:hypothetical protein